jgi:hypothetical protein
VYAGRFEPGAVHANAASPVGDAGGHDGSEGGVSVRIELPEPPLRHCRNLQFTAAPTGSGVSGGRALCMQDVLSRALFMQTQHILWETPEVTTAAKAACQSASNFLTHRLRHCRNLQQLPPGPGCLEVGRCACGMFDLLTHPPYSRVSSLHITTRQSLITGAAARTQLVGASSIAFA